MIRLAMATVHWATIASMQRQTRGTTHLRSVNIALGYITQLLIMLRIHRHSHILPHPHPLIHQKMFTQTMTPWILQIGRG